MRRRSKQDADSLGLVFRSLQGFREGGLSLTNALVLVAIATADGESITFSDLLSRVKIGQSSTSRIVAALTEAGLVESLTPPDDRRRSNLRLTERGSSLLGRILKK